MGVLKDREENREEMFPSELLRVTEGAPSIQLDQGASRFFDMVRRVETFWIDEFGKVRPLGPTEAKERAPDGTWKRSYEKYINSEPT